MTRNEDLAEEMMTVVDSKMLDINSDCLIIDTDSQEVAVHIYGYVAKQLIAKTGLSCADLLVRNTKDRAYLDLLSRGGLQTPSQALGYYVCWSFAGLEIFPTITKHGLPGRASAECFPSVSTPVQQAPFI